MQIRGLSLQRLILLAVAAFAVAAGRYLADYQSAED